MAHPNLTLNQQQAVADSIPPQSAAPGVVNGAWVPMSNFSKLQHIVEVGTFGAASTFDAKLEQATDIAGAGAKDIDGKAITQLATAGGNDRIAVINVEETELDVNEDYDHVRLVITIAGAATDISAKVLGGEAAQGPASDDQVAAVVEVVA